MRNQVPYKRPVIDDFELESPKMSYLIKDASYKLMSEIRTGTHPYSIAYTYDNVGNRLTQTKDGVLTNYTYNNRDQLTNETGPNNTTYVYDHAGRMTNKTDNAGVTNYTWIDNDRLAQVSGPGVLVNYSYDNNGQRVSETTAAGTKRYLVDYQLPYGQVIGETDGSGNLVAGYVYGLERISQSRGGNVHFYAADGQGSTRQLTNASGNVTDSWTFDAFGNTINRTGTTENSFLYVGEGFDPNCGFYNLRARWYNPANARFTSVDPYDGKKTETNSLHRYQYANASPVNFTDPSGKFSLIEVMDAVAIYGILQTVAIPISHLYYGGGRRPDDDKRLTFIEAALWWKAGNGKELNIDLSSIDLSAVSQDDFYKDGMKLGFASVSLAGKNYSSFNDALVYGHITLSLSTGNSVYATLGYDMYDFDVSFNPKAWDTGGEIVRNVETIGGEILHGPGKPFKINLIGSATIGE